MPQGKIVDYLRSQSESEVKESIPVEVKEASDIKPKEISSEPEKVITKDETQRKYESTVDLENSAEIISKSAYSNLDGAEENQHSSLSVKEGIIDIQGNERYIPLEDNLTIFKGDSSFDEKCFKGKLYFTLVGVKDLEKSDYIGKSDPYALIYYKEEVFKSETISNNLNPVWNLAITIDIDLIENDELNIKIFDEDYDIDDSLGSVSLRVKDLIACKDIELQSSKLEESKSGEIIFSSYSEPERVEFKRQIGLVA